MVQMIEVFLKRPKCTYSLLQFLETDSNQYMEILASFNLKKKKAIQISKHSIGRDSGTQFVRLLTVVFNHSQGKPLRNMPASGRCAIVSSWTWFLACASKTILHLRRKWSNTCYPYSLQRRSSFERLPDVSGCFPIELKIQFFISLFMSDVNNDLPFSWFQDAVNTQSLFLLLMMQWIRPP